MSTFHCPHCGKAVDIFGHGEGAKTAAEYGVPVLGEVEIDPRIRLAETRETGGGAGRIGAGGAELVPRDQGGGGAAG